MLRTLVFICCALWCSTALEGICELIEGNGYGCEEHFPQTPDGFLLGLFRIPPKTKGAPAVLLQHGLYDSCATFINNLPYESLGYILHDHGYDVWLSNSRGNAFSMQNTKHKKSSTEFWDLVDWDQMGRYDVPTNVDFIRNQTGHDTISYVGHSQGTTQMLAALGSDIGTEIEKKVNIFVALAPVAYVNHLTDPFMKILAKLHAGKIFQLLGIKEFIGTNTILHDLGIACNVIPHGCDEILLILCGGDMKNLNGTRMDFYTNWEPSPTSVHNLEHWAQMVRNGKNFQMYDWGERGNLKHYNQKTPPTYNINNITMPTAIFAGGKDELADPTDVEKLLGELHNVVHINTQPEYGHLDFVWGLNAHTKIYPDVLTLLKKYNPLPEV